MLKIKRYSLHPEKSWYLKINISRTIWNTCICIQLLGEIITSLENYLGWIFQMKPLRLSSVLYLPYILECVFWNTSEIQKINSNVPKLYCILKLFFHLRTGFGFFRKLFELNSSSILLKKHQRVRKKSTKKWILYDVIHSIQHTMYVSHRRMKYC